MENSRVLKSVLFLAGLVLILAGSRALFLPVAFMSGHGIDFGGNINMLNETRGTGGLLVGSGVLVLLGAFVSQLTFTSSVVSVFIYLFFAAARILSIVIDGTPVTRLVVVTTVETVIGLIVLFVFIKYRER